MPTPAQQQRREEGSAETNRLIEEACERLHVRLEQLKPQALEFNLLRMTLLGLESRLPTFLDKPRSKAERALASICFEPGMSTQQVADDCGIKVASLYPVLRILRNQGLAHTVTYRWFPGTKDGTYTNVLDVAKI